MTAPRVTIVGCGAVAQQRHIPSFLKLREEVSISAVCDVNLALAKDVARKFGIPRAYNNVSEMLSKEDPDIVDICTPPQAHTKLALEAMENGCHVLIEKPMALTVGDCEEMIRASRAYGSKLCIAHNARFSPPFLKSIELVKKGTIGEVISVRMLSLTRAADHMSREGDWIHKLRGGVIWETGPHMVYTSLPFVRNVRNVHVTARKTLSYPWVLFDTYSLQLSGDSAVSYVFLSHASNYVAWEVDVLGTRGMIRMDLHSMLLRVHMRRDVKPISLAMSALTTSRKMATGVASNAFLRLRGRSFLGHDLIARKFVESVKRDSPPPVSPEEGMETIRVMEQISSMCTSP